MIAGILLLLGLLVPPARAARCDACDPCLTGGAAADRAALATVRAALDLACPCADFDGSRGRTAAAYRRCIRSTIRAATAAGVLRRPCRSLLTRSVCGRPSRVVCCEQRRGTDAPRCAVRPSARCIGSRRLAASVESCADTDCSPSGTTTTTTTGVPTTTSTSLAPSWAALHAAFLAPRCGACHGLEGEGGLNGLHGCRSGYASLVDVPSTQLPGRDRVEPGAPTLSWLVHKLDGDQGAFGALCAAGTCGDAMPCLSRRRSTWRSGTRCARGSPAAHRTTARRSSARCGRGGATSCRIPRAPGMPYSVPVRARLAPLIVLVASALGSAAPGFDGADLSDLGHDGFRVDLSAPADWRCRHAASCVTCWNVSGHASPVSVHRSDGRAPIRRRIPAGQALRMCPQADATAGDA